jgi:hypothetical protein
METHVRVAAWLRIIASALYLLGALFVLLFFGGLGGLISVAGDADARSAAPIVEVVGVFISCFLGLLALPGLVTGWGLLAFRPWARVVDIALSAFDLFHVPIGTALGTYSIWVMLQPETVELFDTGGAVGRYPTHF